MTKATLKPCPFCGGEAEQNCYGAYDLGEESQEIQCGNLACRARPSVHQTQSEYGEWDLADTWNERVT